MTRTLASGPGWLSGIDEIVVPVGRSPLRPRNKCGAGCSAAPPPEEEVSGRSVNLAARLNCGGSVLMDFKFSAEDVAFRDEVLDFLGEQLPPGWADLSEGPAEDGAANRERWEFTRGFHRALADRGWLTLGWPQEHGGAGAGPIRQAMFNETMAHHRAPVYNQGVDRVGPTVIMYGSDEQKEFFLPRIRSADIQWCQGFSEPGSGSDLASLQTRAQRDGDDYIINGQKIWTSGAQHADYIFMLARTEPDAPKHRGISFFLVDMKTPGITVRPLVNMANRHHFNEVFFEDVRVPAKNRVGEENRGWYVATTTLDFERSGISRVVSGVRLLGELTDLASQPGPDGRRPDEDPRDPEPAGRSEHRVHGRPLARLPRRLDAVAGPGPEPRGLNVEALRDNDQSAPGRDDQHVRPGRRALGRAGARSAARPDAGRVPQLGAVDDRGGDVGDHAQHHCDARSRSASVGRILRSLMRSGTSPPSENNGSTTVHRSRERAETSGLTRFYGTLA